jgi:hypothetical protein
MKLLFNSKKSSITETLTKELLKQLYLAWPSSVLTIQNAQQNLILTAYSGKTRSWEQRHITKSLEPRTMQIHQDTLQ